MGNIIALKCHKYKDFLPHIAEVKEIDDSSVTINWMNGSYSGTWTYWKSRGRVIVETYPNRAILMTIKLTKAQRLTKGDAEKLRSIYSNTEFI